MPLPAYISNDLNEVLAYINSQELSKCNKVCYVPVMSRYLSDIEAATKDYNIPDKPFPYKILNVPFPHFLLRLYQQVTDPDIAKKIIICLALYIYGVLFKKHFRFCDPTRMNYAISQIHGTHLFKRHGIGPALQHLSAKIFQLIGLAPNDDKVIQLYLRLRTAISQSIKSLSAKYYAYDPDEIASKEKVAQFIDTLSGLLANKILQNGVDKDLIRRVSSRTNVNEKQLHDIIYQCIVDTIFSKDFIQLLLAGIDNKDDCCNMKWYASITRRALQFKKNPLSILLTKQTLKVLEIAQLDYEADPKNIAKFYDELQSDQQQKVEQVKRAILLYYYYAIFQLLCH